MNFQLALAILGITILFTLLGFLVGYKIASDEARRHVNRVLNQVGFYGRVGDK